MKTFTAMRQYNTLYFRAIMLLLFLIGTGTGCQQKTEKDNTAENLASETEVELLTEENAAEKLMAYGEANPDTIAVISTRHGDIKVRLYNETPLHRANFVRLAKGGFYSQGEFYRVLEGFAVQGGDSDDREMELGAYRIPQEFNPNYIHNKGALAMARYGDERNPEKESSSHNFYLVQGTPKTEAELQAFEAQHNKKYTPEQREIYKTLGGTPSLDHEYTVFGEIIEGMEVLDKIAAEPVDGQKWPKNLVKHRITIP